MENLVKTSVNRVLNRIVDQAICEALILLQRAEEETRKQKQKERAGESYNYSTAGALREGSQALCRVLWEIFGKLPADNIRAIEIIFEENKNNTCLGYDSRDYIKMFKDALMVE